MLRAVLSLLLLLCLPLPGRAQCPGVTTQLVPFATEQLTISSAPVPLTASVYKPSGTTANVAMLSVEGGMIRYKVVGAPTSAAGHPVSGTPPQTITICGFDSIAAFKAIRVTTDATVTVTYYRPK
jgi:hypothetical protein